MIGYHSWRRIGDAAGSLFALDYHERIDQASTNVPIFIVELRKAAFARIYAADKSLAIFLGRPPRINKGYCTFQLPSNVPGLWETEIAVDANGILESSNNSAEEQEAVSHSEAINYTADTRCSAKFALLKEEVLELFRHRHCPDQRDKSKLVSPLVGSRSGLIPTH